MVDQDKEDQDLKKEGNQEVPLEEELAELGELKEPSVEKHELTEEELQRSKAEIEKTELDDHLKAQAHSHAQDIQSLGGEEKIQKLLLLAKEKGVVYAVNVAKKMNDPFLVDALHDALAKEGYYKQFKK